MAGVTLSDLRARVAQRAALVVSPNSRHTPTSVDREINESLERYYQILTDSGHPERTTRTTLTTSASETVTLGWPANEYVQLPADFKHLLSAHIRYNDQLFPMREFAEVEREQDGYWIAEPNVPRQFRIANATSGRKILRLVPAAVGVYTIEVVYAAVPTALSSDSDTFDFLTGTADWVVCDVALTLLESEDETSSGTYDRIARRRNEVRGTLERQAGRSNRSGPKRMLATDRIHSNAGWWRR
jgi:hypothetical protein